MSESALDLYQPVTLPDWSTTVQAHRLQKSELMTPTYRRRSTSMPKAPERPPCPLFATSELPEGIESLSGQAAPIPLFGYSCNEATPPLASISPVTPRARVSSQHSNGDSYTQASRWEGGKAKDAIGVPAPLKFCLEKD